MTWTEFWDMHSGGRTKVEPYDKIYIEAPEDAARMYFSKRFERDPDNVTCSCCGSDYSVSQDESLAQLTGHHRHLRCVETKRDPVTKLFINSDPNVRYLEEGEEPPEGYGVSKISLISRNYYKPLSLDEYMKDPRALFIHRGTVIAALHPEATLSTSGSSNVPKEQDK